MVTVRMDRDESTVMDCDIEIYQTVEMMQTQTAMAQDLTGGARTAFTTCELCMFVHTDCKSHHGAGELSW